MPKKTDLTVRKVSDEMIFGRLLPLMECLICGHQWLGAADCPGCAEIQEIIDYYADDDPVAWGCPPDRESQ